LLLQVQNFFFSLAEYKHEAEYRLREAVHVYEETGHYRLHLAQMCLKIMEKEKVIAVKRNLAPKVTAITTENCDILWLLENVAEMGRMIRFGYESAKRHDVI